MQQAGLAWSYESGRQQGGQRAREIFLSGREEVDALPKVQNCFSSKLMIKEISTPGRRLGVVGLLG